MGVGGGGATDYFFDKATSKKFKYDDNKQTKKVKTNNVKIKSVFCEGRLCVLSDKELPI